MAHRALLKRAGRCSNQGRGVGTGPQLIWSGRPDAIGRSELGVQWSPPDARARYRVYLGDERVLSAALGLTVDASQPRAERAFTVWQRQAQLAGKESFSLLTEEPIGADGDGVVRFRHQLPAGLRGVQFLRVVPVSAAQVEAEFSACGLVPVAVPALDRPPAPTLRVRMEEGTGARLLVEAQGLRPDVLAARGFPGSGQNPEYRLRRTRGRLADALYMPVVDQAALSSGDGTRWTAEVVEPLQELPPFVRAVWAAEARYPAEQAVADGATPVTDPLAITGLGPQPSFLEGEWSAASLVASTVVIPDAEPPPVAGATARRRIIHGEDVVILRVPAPLSDPRAMGPWKVAVYRRLDGQAPELLTPEEVHTSPYLLVDSDDPQLIAYDVALVDPAGRQGEPARVQVP